jgi:hypothetical protein
MLEGDEDGDERGEGGGISENISSEDDNGDGEARWRKGVGR